MVALELKPRDDEKYWRSERQEDDPEFREPDTTLQATMLRRLMQ